MKKRRILNVGCGNDVYGTDFVDLYPFRSEIIKCDLDSEELPYKTEAFDEVYSGFMIEHMRNINSAIEKMKRVLKRSGKIVLKTDNAGWWAFHNSKSKALVHYGGYGSHGKKDIHYALFTPEHLKNHLEYLGFKKITFCYFEGEEGKVIKLINYFLSKTRFKFMAYPHIKIEAIKS